VSIEVATITHHPFGRRFHAALDLVNTERLDLRTRRISERRSQWIRGDRCTLQKISGRDGSSLRASFRTSATRVFNNHGAHVSNDSRADTEDEKGKALTVAFRVAFRKARSFGVRGADAEDVASKAMTRALASWDKFVEQGEGSRIRWAWTIAKNVLMNRHRDRAAAAASAPAVALSEGQQRRVVSPEEAVMNSDASKKRDELFAALNPALQVLVSIVAQQATHEISRADAAKSLGLSVHSYDKVALKVKRELKRAAEARFIDPHELFGKRQRRGRTRTSNGCSSSSRRMSESDGRASPRPSCWTSSPTFPQCRPKTRLRLIASSRSTTPSKRVKNSSARRSRASVVT
jgi:DNA-directed RNA polymerase specialized sigma24 family protein